jgi:hypothetical protein
LNVSNETQIAHLYRSHDDEDKLINHAIERAKLGIGFSKQNFLKFAGDLAPKHYELYKNQTKNIELKI